MQRTVYDASISHLEKRKVKKHSSTRPKVRLRWSMRMVGSFILILPEWELLVKYVSQLCELNQSQAYLRQSERRKGYARKIWA